MKKKLLFLLLSLIAIGSVLTGCGENNEDVAPPTEEPAAEEPVVEEPAAEDALVAVKTDSPISIDGTSEDIWEEAEAYTVKVVGGASLQGSGGDFENGSTEVAIKASYDDENLYLNMQWADADESQERGPWVKENGELVSKPYSDFYEDKFAILWNVDDSVVDFNEKGCTVACHQTEYKDDNDKTIVKHNTNAENELLDMWHWKSVRQNTLNGPDEPGLMHDQFMDNVVFDPEDEATKGGGRHADPGEKEYRNNKTEDGTAPESVFDGPVKNGNPYVIVEGIDSYKPYTPEYLETMAEGDFIPGLYALPLTGDPADIIAKGNWENGVWTLEIQRKLTTESDKDVQFEDLAKEYFFGVSAFDNSQIGHAYQTGVQKLIFKK